MPSRFNPLDNGGKYGNKHMEKNLITAPDINSIFSCLLIGLHFFQYSIGKRYISELDTLD